MEKSLKSFPAAEHTGLVSVFYNAVSEVILKSLYYYKGVEVVLKTGTMWLPKRRGTMISFFSYSIIYLNNEKLFWSHKMCIYKK